MRSFKKLPEVYKFWVILAIATTLLSLLIYGTNQQIIRRAANDPQIQIAADMASKLERNQKPIPGVVEEKIDLQLSMSPFYIIYDKNKISLSSSAVLNNQIPTLPVGVLDYTKAHVEHRLTWEPKPGIREAVVIRYFRSETTEGYVLVGRSLKETEIRQLMLIQEVVVGWLVTLAATGLAAHLIKKL